MAKFWQKNGIISVITRIRIQDTSSVNGGGKTGLTNSSVGLIISTIADNEAAATTYTQAGSLIDTITSLGTFAAPTAGHVRFKELDAVNFPGVYELQIADARFAVSGARSLMIGIPYVVGLGIFCAPTEVQLTAFDPQTATQPVNVTQWLGQAVAAAVNGIPKVDVTYILGTLLTETAGQIAAGVKKFFNVATPTMDVTSINQTGDSFARLGAPAGASIEADIAAVKVDTAATRTQVGIAGAGLTSLGDTRIAHLDADVSTRLATSAYTAPDNTDIGLIKAKTDNIPSSPATSAAVAAIPTNPLLTDDVRITDIKTKVDLLPSDPASETSVETAITASGNTLSALVNEVKTKTDALPADPTSTSTLLEVEGDIRGDIAALPSTSGIASAFSALQGHGDTTWSTANVASLLTAAGFSSAITALESYGDTHWTTANVGALLTAAAFATAITNLIAHGDANWEDSGGATVDQIWNELSGSHTVSGSLGLLLAQIYSKMSFVGVDTVIASFMDRRGNVTIDQGTDSTITWRSNQYDDLADAVILFKAEPTTVDSTSPNLSLPVNQSFDVGTGFWTLTLQTTHAASAVYDAGKSVYSFKVMATLASGDVKALERGFLNVDAAIV